MSLALISILVISALITLSTSGTIFYLLFNSKYRKEATEHGVLIILESLIPTAVSMVVCAAIDPNGFSVVFCAGINLVAWLIGVFVGAYKPELERKFISSRRR